MVRRRYWVDRIESAWSRRSVAWLRGVRRSGKTFLSQSLPGVEYFDCELPRVRRRMEDPEQFLAELSGKRVVLDEIHRLGDPAQLLKIAADHFPSIKILATGSSVLEAMARFRDKLTGRKAEIWLTPMNSRDLEDFGGGPLSDRLARGGLPPFFLSPAPPDRDIQEWMDSFWAKDIQELFRLERRSSFARLMELLFAQSGGIFEATRFSGPCELSRQSVVNYLAVLEATMAVHLVRPYSSRRATEIIAAPKIYAFDTGFACYFKGWDRLREEDLGHLWEHYVLNELHSLLQAQPRYWRDKQGHEVDFVLAGPRREPLAIECKWKAASFDPASLAAFRKLHPGGENLVVCHDVDAGFLRSARDLKLQFCGMGELARRLDPRRDG